MHAKHHRSAPETWLFEDDGWIPNNPHLPFVVFRAAIDLKGSPDPEALVEDTFRSHGWGECWRNSAIHPYTHYHSRIHEAMGIARGRAKVLFGGESGAVVELNAGDVVVLPAGTGHQGIWQSPDLVVVGAYPPVGRYDLCRGSRAEHSHAVAAIPHVPLPATDPVRGKNGPLIRLWRTEHLHSATA
jgi:uncharacterized protein YjlB